MAISGTRQQEAWTRARTTCQGQCQIMACCSPITSPTTDDQCRRCGRVVCGSCRGFGVSTFVPQGQDAAAHDDGSLSHVCGECVMDMLERISRRPAAAEAASPTTVSHVAVFTYLSSERVPAWQAHLRASQLEKQRLEIEREAEAETEALRGPLERQITSIEAEKARLQGEAHDLHRRAELAIADKPTPIDAEMPRGPTPADGDLETLLAEYRRLEGADTNGMDETQAIQNFTRLSELGALIEAAQIAQTEAATTAPQPSAQSTPVQSRGTTTTTANAGEDTLEVLQEKYRVLLETDVNGMTDDEQITFLAKRHDIETKLEAAQMAWAQDMGQVTVPSNSSLAAIRLDDGLPAEDKIQALTARLLQLDEVDVSSLPSAEQGNAPSSLCWSSPGCGFTP